MNRVLLLAAACLCLNVSSTFAQKRTPVRAQRTEASVSTSSPKMVCVGAQIPDGYVAISLENAASCRQGAWKLKKPDAIEIVCDGSPLPDGYEVKEIKGVAGCGGVNPLSNAMVIARAGTAYSLQAALPSRAIHHSSAQPRYHSDTAEDNHPTNDNAPRRSDSEEDSGSVIRPSRPSRNEIDVAIRRSTVLIGMDYQDVTRAWGGSHTTDSLIEDGLRIEIWGYSRGRVYFRNGRVYKAMLLK